MPLRVVLGLKVPQLATGVQLHVTPAFPESLATVAVIDVVLLRNNAVGVVLNVTVIGTVTVAIVIVALALFVVSVTDVTLIITVLPVGTADGAV